MKILDLHCDTIEKIVSDGRSFTDPAEMHVNLPGLVSSGTVLQVFACFVLSDRYQGREDEVCNGYIDAIEKLLDKHADRLFPVRAVSDLDTVERSIDRTGILIGIEGATPLMGKVENLHHFYDRGVRLLTIAWDDNEFCGTVFGGGGGLTPLGAELVELCNELGIAVDVSHASDKGFYDISALTDVPFTASHSNARTVCPSDRNLDDDMIRILADRGGVIGLTYGSGFICPNFYSYELKNRKRILAGFKDKSLTLERALAMTEEALKDVPPATLGQLVDHARHIMNVGGEDCLALGSDFDGVYSLPEGFSGTGSLPLLVNEMERQGISDRAIEKICWKNGVRFLGEVL